MITEKPIEIIRDMPDSETREEEFCTVKEVGVSGCFAVCDLYYGVTAVLRNSRRTLCYVWMVEHCTDETKYRDERMNETVSDFSTVGALKEYATEMYGSLEHTLARWKKTETT